MKDTILAIRIRNTEVGIIPAALLTTIRKENLNFIPFHPIQCHLKMCIASQWISFVVQQFQSLVLHERIHIQDNQQISRQINRSEIWHSLEYARWQIGNLAVVQIEKLQRMTFDQRLIR